MRALYRPFPSYPTTPQMDSQHRHELEQNDLEVWMKDTKDKIAPYTGAIVTAVIAIVVAGVGYSLISQSNAQADSAAWQSYSLAFVGGRPSLNALEETSEEFDGTVSDWADITWADGQLWTASNLYLTNRPTAEEALGKAKEKFEALIKSASDKKIKNRAKFGLARAYELEGDVEKAGEQYKQVGGAFKELAENRTEKLAEEAVKADYTWLTSAVASKGRRGSLPTGDQPDMTPDDVALPEASAETAPVNTEETLGDILKSYGESDEASPEVSTEESAADSEESTESGSSEAEEPADAASEEANTDSSESEDKSKE